jgi:hypothetical protein
LISPRIRKATALIALAAAFGATALPAKADDEALKREIEELKKRLTAVEKELEQSKKSKPAKSADALNVRNGSKLQFSGFAETRITNIGTQQGDRVKNGDLDFQVTRFRPRFVFTADDHISADLQLNASTRSAGATFVNVRDAYLTYQNDGWYTRFGQGKIPYGYQTFRQGDEVAQTLERARVFTTLFPDERDIGLVVGTRSKNPRAASFHVGVVSGDGINHSDGDGAKSVVGKIEVPIGRPHILGMSFYTGTSTTPDATLPQGVRSQVKRAFGPEYRLTLGRLTGAAEYLWGRAFAADVNGGYGLLSYNTGRIGNFFIRHDLFDPDEDAADDYWSRTGIGWFKDFTKQFRLTAEYDFVRNKKTNLSSDNTFGIEAQLNF